MKGFLSSLSVMALSCVCAAQFKPYSVSADFHEIANNKAFAKLFHIDPQSRAMLKQNLFVVTPSDATQLYDVYSTNDYDNFPSFITADSVLHVYHVFYDGLLRKIEQDSLLKNAISLSQNMVVESAKQYNDATDPAVKQAALKNCAMFAVAIQLFGATASDIPADAQPMIDAEMKLIQGHAGMDQSAIFQGKEDYSMFIVRGHYTKSEALGKYFQGMTMLAMPIPLTNEDGTPAQAGIEQSVLIAKAAQAGTNPNLWQSIYEPTGLFVGPSNMYTPDEFRQAASDTVGLGTPDMSKAPGLIEKLGAIRQPLIIHSQKKVGAGQDVQFTFMGRRFIPDSMALQNLTSETRTMVSGMDVMSVLGSKRADQIIDNHLEVFNPKGWTPYGPERATLRDAFAGAPENYWGSNLYTGWLGTIKSYIAPVPQGYPSFMHTTAWQDKRLSTALASWPELRHDTLLYGEQSAAEKGDGREEIPYTPQFVEPCPDTFQRLSNLIKLTQSELLKRNMLDAEGGESLQNFGKLVSFLLDMVKKELAGQKMTKEENERVRFIESEFEDPTLKMLQYGTNIQALNEDDLDMALVADVHSAGTIALEEGVGHGDMLLAVVPIDGKLYLARGNVFSYYEFNQPVSERLTDQKWKQMMRDKKGPARPFWIKSYFSNKAIPVNEG